MHRTVPTDLIIFQLGPALMAGNTVVCKPSEMTTVTAWMLMKLFHEAGTVQYLHKECLQNLQVLNPPPPCLEILVTSLTELYRVIGLYNYISNHYLEMKKGF